MVAREPRPLMAAKITRQPVWPLPLTRWGWASRKVKVHIDYLVQCVDVFIEFRKGERFSIYPRLSLRKGFIWIDHCGRIPVNPIEYFFLGCKVCEARATAKAGTRAKGQDQLGFVP